jgi:MFS family permease
MNAQAARELLGRGEFRFLWIGVVASQIGDWMQITAQGWLVLDMTRSPMTLALVTASGIIPQLIFVLIGGLAADRYNKKQLMRGLVAAQLLVSAVLTVLVTAQRVDALTLGIFSFALGICAALWQPLYLSFIPNLVPPERLSNAMGMSLAGLYTARTLGPILAGLSIAVLGTRNTYIFNTLSFLVPLAVLSFIRTDATAVERKQGVLADLAEGSRLVLRDPVLLPLWVLGLGVSLLVSPAFVLLPVFAKEILKGGAAELGVLMGAAGFGQLLGALWATIASGAEDKRYGQRQILGYIAIGFLLVVFAVSESLPVSVILLGTFNLLYGVLSPRVNTIIHLRVRSALRGRVQGIFLFIFGLVPVGQVGIGRLAESWGAQVAVLLPSLLFTLLAGTVLIFAPQLRRVGVKKGQLSTNSGEHSNIATYSQEES